MPRELLMPGRGGRVLNPGDVVFVSREMRDKETRKAFNWRFLGAVVRVGGRDTIQVEQFGQERDKPLMLTLLDAKNTVYFIPPDEWPDGVHAFRTRLILEGKLDCAVFED